MMLGRPRVGLVMALIVMIEQARIAGALAQLVGRVWLAEPSALHLAEGHLLPLPYYLQPHDLCK